MNKKKTFIEILFLIIYASLLIFFIYECMKDASESTKSSNFVVEIIANIFSFFKGSKYEISDNFSLIIRKLIGHFGYFFILGIFSIIYHLLLNGFNKKASIAIHFIIGIGFAAISEFFLEGNTKGRSASFYDVLIDSGGFLLSSLIILLIYYLRKRNQKSKVLKNTN